jgi:hypothetical protein
VCVGGSWLGLQNALIAINHSLTPNQTRPNVLFKNNKHRRQMVSSLFLSIKAPIGWTDITLNLTCFIAQHIQLKNVGKPFITDGRGRKPRSGLVERITPHLWHLQLLVEDVLYFQAEHSVYTLWDHQYLTTSHWRCLFIELSQKRPFATLRM